MPHPALHLRKYTLPFFGGPGANHLTSRDVQSILRKARNRADHETPKAYTAADQKMNNITVDKEILDINLIARMNLVATPLQLQTRAHLYNCKRVLSENGGEAVWMAAVDAVLKSPFQSILVANSARWAKLQ